MSAALLIALALFLCTLAWAAVLVGWKDALAIPAGNAEEPAIEFPKVSIIVPVRNEEEDIVPLLQDLYAQRYPREQLEVIVVDDHSEDRTFAIVQGMMRNWPGLKVLSSSGVGKKAAITQGVAAARGELVLLTDADVRCGPERVGAVTKHWACDRSDMIVLPVITQGHGLVGAVQADEQAGLLGVTMASAAQGKPVLAYGANLAFTREAFNGVGGYEGDRFASGDDVFLLQRMKNAGGKVTVLFSPEAAVYAKAEPTVRGALWQRMRWAGKMRGALNATSLLALLALLFPWVLLQRTCAFSLSGSMGQHALYTGALLGAAWLLWLFPVVGFVSRVVEVVATPAPKLRVLCSFLAFTCYAPLVAAASLVVRSRWKGRRV